LGEYFEFIKKSLLFFYWHILLLLVLAPGANIRVQTLNFFELSLADFFAF